MRRVWKHVDDVFGAFDVGVELFKCSTDHVVADVVAFDE